MPLSVAMALSGIEPDQWDDNLKHIYNQGMCALKKTRQRSASVGSSTSTFLSTTESGISSFSSRSDDQSSTGSNHQQDMKKMYAELISKLEKLTGNEYIKTNKEKTKSEQLPNLPNLPDVKMMYNGRDILDLGANFKQTKPFYTATVLPNAIIDNNYFQNRSQYSRVLNILPPPHENIKCEDCDFVETVYF